MASASTLRSAAAFVGRATVRVLRLPPREMLTALHVMAVLAAVEALIRWVPLPRLSRMLGLRVNLDPVGADREPMSFTELPPRSQRQLFYAHRVANRWPLAQGPCLRRALVAGHLLRRHDPAVRLGVGGAGDEIHAHAWLEIDDRPLEGVDSFSAFQRPTTEAPE